MSLKSVLAAVANTAVLLAKDYTPHGKAISLLAHAVNVASGGNPKFTLTPNIVSMIDADTDSIDDRVDADKGTVAAVTDEMLKAGRAEVVKIWESAGYTETPEFPLAGVYLAMYAARPQR